MTRNLTLNMGLRFEYEDGIREKDDGMLVGFDPDALTSISQAAEAAYLASGVASTPGMLPRIGVRGGSVFATDSGHPASWERPGMWMPRVPPLTSLARGWFSRGGGSLLRHAERRRRGEWNGSSLPDRLRRSPTGAPETAQILAARSLQLNTGQGRSFLGACQMAPVDTRSVPRSVTTRSSAPRTRIRISTRALAEQRWRVSVQRAAGEQPRPRGRVQRFL